jgi:hypothetical protein
MAEEESKKIELDKLEEELERAGAQSQKSETANEKQYELIQEIEKSLKGGPGQPEQQAEQANKTEQQLDKRDRGDTRELNVSGSIGAVDPSMQASQKRQKQIERVLEEDLAEYYLAMPEKDRQIFRQKGEETARNINSLFEAGKAKLGKLVSLIRDWLAMIPGINSLFLEQEAKKKADAILKCGQDGSDEIRVL